ncbi:toprim domain-containing protein [Elizabethkingia miricola]|uniref:toprim domain-containing protein n=1 Tax=Elizabethkingia miricola TaxID=172045 RepID=UPI001F3A14B3|nr:toprim domain-containing protein [Elizabethkingia miricola]UIO95447.1 toprim domain-containing protein [Elizabethkingia miricola]
MMKYLKASVKEVLEWAENQNFFSFQPQNSIQKQNSLKQNYQITEIKEFQNENLKDYLHQRGLSTKVYPLVKEIHFKMNGKNLYAIGFENLSGGWELRNSFYKGSLLMKDISILNFNNESQNQNETGKRIAIFEGFIDALSFVEMKPFYNGYLLVMNSISLLNKTKDHLKNYSEIHLFLDNDKAGETCKNSILKSFPEAKDHSEIYALHKDLNDYLKSKKENKNSIEISNSILKTEEEETKQPYQIYKRKR